jgi:hypothetical protein
MSHEKPVEPFSDLHVEDNRVRATLLHDPTVEGLEMALYLDGSGSMSDEYEYQTQQKSFWESLFGGAESAVTLPNQVEPQAQWMLEYLATKDRNGVLRAAYWATGSTGKEIEVIGDLQGTEARNYKFSGPRAPGGQTHLKPAIEDYVNYLKSQTASGAKRGGAVFITDGVLHDADAVISYTRRIAADIEAGRLPRTTFILVGIGDQVDEEQLESISHEDLPGVGHLWCHRIAGEITQVAELVAGLVDETMTVGAGGTIYDDNGKVLKVYEARLPAVLEFDVPANAKSFTLEISGQRFTQPIPEEDED